jgi:hypothetical protein
MNEQFECNDALADFLVELQATQTKYFALRRQNSPDAGKVLEKSKENEVKLSKFLADRAAQKKAEIQKQTAPTLF